jgi:hypothetical protein
MVSVSVSRAGPILWNDTPARRIAASTSPSVTPTNGMLGWPDAPIGSAVTTAPGPRRAQRANVDVGTSTARAA